MVFRRFTRNLKRKFYENDLAVEKVLVTGIVALVAIGAAAALIHFTTDRRNLNNSQDDLYSTSSNEPSYVDDYTKRLLESSNNHYDGGN